VSKLKIEYKKHRVTTPMSFWVHKPVDSEIWSEAAVFESPMPGPVIGKGFPVYELQYRDNTLVFGSKTEIDHCISVLSKKVLPTTRELAEEGGYAQYQHLHWLSKWPGDVKSWKDRQKIVKLLRALRDETI